MNSLRTRNKLRFFYRVTSLSLSEHTIALTDSPLIRALQKAIARSSRLGDATTEITRIAEKQIRADVLTGRDTKSRTRTRRYRDRGWLIRRNDCRSEAEGTGDEWVHRMRM